MTVPPPPLRALLRDAVDYAGLFPPAALAMEDAAANYAAYRRGPDRWALGRFVVPATRLDALERAAEPWLADAAATGDPWRLSVLVGPGVAMDEARIARFGERHAPGTGSDAVVVDAVESRTAGVDDVMALRDALPPSLEIYCEVPADADPAPLLEAIARAGLRGKLRTGGVTPEAIPSADVVARFLALCTALDLPFKATAGLHHPLRGEYALTYAADAPRGTMHGWLNVLLAAVLLADGLDERDAIALLEERDPRAFRVDGDAIAWRGRRIDADAIARSRARGAIGFGSCSFREPLDDLAAIPSLGRIP